MHVKCIQSLNHMQLLAGDIFYRDSIKELEELITLPDIMYIYIIWIAPALVAI